MEETLNKQPVIAICYDFDKTLSPYNMQECGFIQEVGFNNVADFWEKSNTFAAQQNMDQNLAYMYTMINEAKGKVLFTKDNLKKFGQQIELFPGVETWFNRINSYAEQYGILVEHYIISSGLKEMIEGTVIAKEFRKIYATSFCYDDNGVPFWPAQSINYTNKTQFLFRISKDVLDINDFGVNKFIPSQNLRIPFRNIIYIGDSDTDIPCMKLVNDKGGYSIGVYNPKDESTKSKEKVHQLVKDGRISHFAAADYTESGELDRLVKLIIDKTKFNEELHHIHNNNLKEAIGYISNTTENRKRLIDELNNSTDREKILNIFHKLVKFNNWEHDEVLVMFNLAINHPHINDNIEESIINKTYDNLIKYAFEKDPYYNDVLDLIIKRN